MQNNNDYLQHIKDNLYQEFLEVKAPSINDLQEVDLIVVLAAVEVKVEGENRKRLETALSLKTMLPKPEILYVGTKNHISFLLPFLTKKNLLDEVGILEEDNIANTKIQIQDLDKYLQSNHFNTILFVSHLYHIPRIVKYCKKYLPKKVSFFYYPIGTFSKQQDKIRIEIEKIIEYAQKGDLDL